MISLSSLRRAVLAVATALSFAMAGCGKEEAPTIATPPPAAGGEYFVQWTLQILRKSDGFQKQFRYVGRMTIVQDPPVGSTSTLSGFAVVDAPGAPASYDLNGSVSAGGAIEFTTHGPKPPEGPCPGGRNVRHSGQVSTDDSGTRVSTRGITTVTCPEFGEHEFTYLVIASK